MHHILCSLDEIPNGTARGFTVNLEGITSHILVIRYHTAVYAYENLCPHALRRLDLYGGDFMSVDHNLLQCSLHFAQFRIEDGYCIYGPCQGAKLRAITVWVDQGNIVVPKEEL